ncbi:MAG TPA: phosphocholine cytidylyltransferase family protein [Bacteroidota bacterium]|nr:phosphocholine cytidylyltransferase family protein [Bacteroidota bacterium]
MHCVLLAAGTATRLRPLTNDTPKCLLPIGPMPMLERTLRAVSDAGVKNFTIVLGFEAQKIRDFVAEHFPSLAVRFIMNDDYAGTNNAFSLLLARSSVGRDALLLLDSDILFDESILTLLLHSPHETCLAVRTAGEIGDEEIKVKINHNHEIVEIGKHVALESTYGESIGIEKFSHEATQILFHTLQKRVVTENRINEYYEASFQEMIDAGAMIFAEDVGIRRCMEVDTIDDLKKAERTFGS